MQLSYKIWLKVDLEMMFSEMFSETKKIYEMKESFQYIYAFAIQNRMNFKCFLLLHKQF